jgi:hypothetical protein
MNVSALLIRFWPILQPLAKTAVVFGLRRLGEEAKTNALHSAFAPFAEDLDKLCDTIADAIAGKPPVAVKAA